MKTVRSARRCFTRRAASGFATSTTLALLLVLFVAGCGSDDAPVATALDIATSERAPTAVDEPTPTLDEPTAASTVGPATPATAVPGPAATPTPAGDDDFPGWLRVNGFGPVDFGSNLASAQAAIAPRFGDPRDIVEGGDCFLTVANWDDFSLAFESDQFVGWFYRSSTPPLVSPSGVAPGISQSELRRVYSGVDIAESTLGLEFFFEVPAGFIGGFFTPDEQTVNAMFAGQNCFFR